MSGNSTLMENLLCCAMKLGAAGFTLLTCGDAAYSEFYRSGPLAGADPEHGRWEEIGYEHSTGMWFGSAKHFELEPCNDWYLMDQVEGPFEKVMAAIVANRLEAPTVPPPVAVGN